MSPALCQDCDDTRTCKTCGGSCVDPSNYSVPCKVCYGTGLCPFCPPQQLETKDRDIDE